MEALRIPIEVQDAFSGQLDLLKTQLEQSAGGSAALSGALTAGKEAAQQAAGAMVSLTNQMAGDGIRNGSVALEGIAGLLDQMNDGLREAGQWVNSLGGFFDQLGIDAGAAISGISSGLTSLLSGIAGIASMNPLSMLTGANSLLSGISGIGSSLFGRGGLFGGPTENEYMSGGVNELNQLFGSAFSQEVEQAFNSVINAIPRAESGMPDVLAASWHPTTVVEVLENIESFTTDLQNTWSRNLEDHVKPVLMTTLGFSESEAAKLMEPLFREILSRVAPGGELDAHLQGMVSWAERMGVDLSDAFAVAGEAAQEAMETAGETARSAVVNLENDVTKLAVELQQFGTPLERQMEKVALRGRGRELRAGYLNGGGDEKSYAALQAEMASAYEDGKLRGSELNAIRREYAGRGGMNRELIYSVAKMFEQKAGHQEDRQKRAEILEEMRQARAVIQKMHSESAKQTQVLAQQRTTQIVIDGRKFVDLITQNYRRELKNAVDTSAKVD